MKPSIWASLSGAIQLVDTGSCKPVLKFREPVTDPVPKKFQKHYWFIPKHKPQIKDEKLGVTYRLQQI